MARQRPRRARRLSSVVSVVGCAVAALVAGGATAHASCAAAPIDNLTSSQQPVFVGTAVAQRGGFTRFTVHEVWRGPDLADSVWVQTGQRQAPWPLSLFVGVGSSTDANVRTGASYLVGTYGGFRTDACLMVSLDDVSDAAGLRPGPVRAPVPAGRSGAEPPPDPWVLTSAALLLAVGGVGALVWRRRG
ncbi:MAG: hypothetical protein M3P83_03790 [Actinomycetota bacterium]|nr:hypothetical protein [Actinomycetota bacterium]